MKHVVSKHTGCTHKLENSNGLTRIKEATFRFKLHILSTLPKKKKSEEDEETESELKFNKKGTVFGFEQSESMLQFRVCPYCNSDYSTRTLSPQFSNTQTRGDEYFTNITTEALELQDIDPKSKTPHQGRKIMLFSDGRQRAAQTNKSTG